MPGLPVPSGSRKGKGSKGPIKWIVIGGLIVGVIIGGSRFFFNRDDASGYKSFKKDPGSITYSMDSPIGSALQKMKERELAAVDGNWFTPDYQEGYGHDLSDPVLAFLAYLETDQTQEEIQNPIRMIQLAKHKLAYPNDEDPGYTRMREIANSDVVTPDDIEFF
jgi:hypothetical protein